MAVPLSLEKAQPLEPGQDGDFQSTLRASVIMVAPRKSYELARPSLEAVLVGERIPFFRRPLYHARSGCQGFVPAVSVFLLKMCFQPAGESEESTHAECVPGSMTRSGSRQRSATGLTWKAGCG